MIIKIGFKNCPILDLSINDTTIGKQYFQLVKNNYINSFPLFRDRVKYTPEYMLQLAQQASDVLEWDWVRDVYDVRTSTILHKNIEETLAHGFKLVPAEHDHLLHELHYCLHTIQKNENQLRSGWLQIEWYNDQGFLLDESFEFSLGMEFGDVKLQNPHVGHPPQTIFEEQDNINIMQTCKFHDLVRPGINIVIDKYNEVDKEKVIEYFGQYAPDFVNKHGKEKIKHYTGYPVIGRVTNLTDLTTVVQTEILELDFMEFIDE